MDLERLNGSSEFDMVLTKSKDFSPIVSASLTQFLLSTLRKKRSVRIKLDITQSQVKNILKYHFEYFNLLVICLFSENVLLLDKTEKAIPLDTLRYGFKKGLRIQEFAYSQSKSKKLPPNVTFSKEDLKDYHDHFHNSDNIHKSICLGLVCFDHLERDRLNRTRYLNPTGETKSWEDIQSWVSRLFSYNRIQVSNVISHKNTIDDISVLINELFDNTNEWARTNYNNSKFYSPSARSCMLNIFKKDQLNNGFSGCEKTINQYLKGLTELDQSSLQIPELQSGMFDSDDLGVIEISVVDTGPGMARRFLQLDYEDISDENEITAVIKCFQKYLTSDSSATRQIRGRGLSKVVNVIGSTGLIRVRSGHVAISRNFLEHPLDKDIDFSDGLRFDNKQHLNQFEGTCISVLYPYKYKAK